MTRTTRGAVGLNEPASTPTNNAPSTWTGLRHLLDTKTPTTAQALEVLSLARQFRAGFSVDATPLDLLKRYTVATAFYENSTRTRCSFELAAKRLGATVINLDVSTSSTAKGETLEDTGKTLAAMGVNVIVQRHSSTGSAHQLAQALDATGGSTVHVINAGDGCNEHPTQALLDLLTMSDVCEDLTATTVPSLDKRQSPIKVTIIGDILHSRVARSNAWLLNKFGVDVHVVGPPTLVPAEVAECGVTVHHRLEPALQNANFVIVLRMQFERQKEGLIPSLGEYKKLYRLDHARMQLAAPDARVLDPGPVNRDLQITSELADDPKISLISTQVTNGVFVRMAILYLLGTST
jgi:aspartate carbamoyltransferase catalytic subunit